MKQSTDFDDLEAKAQSLRTHLEERSQALTELEKSFHEMNSLIQKYQEGEEGDMSEVDSVENGDKYLDDKDSLVFHGVDVDMLEEQTNTDDPEIRRSFMDHKIRSLLSEKWDLECDAAFKHVFR